MELAWKSIETNEVGIDEFQEWAQKANAEILMAVNLGTRGPAEAAACLEYCNADTDTYYANLRRENGFEKPFGIKNGVWATKWADCGRFAARPQMNTERLRHLPQK